MMADPRPDPDVLLARLKAETPGPARGRLKVFLGACAGVGKTYAMLEAARTDRKSGMDVVAGLVETHGRQETEALLQGLEILPRRETGYRGVRLSEFDLDNALKRGPQVILVDELAHTNAPGSRHLKRWQDVKELLDSGVNVYTTVNIQHLESFNDIVTQITGVVVQETVPDAVVVQADTIELVDLPYEELLKRLQEGKVYLPEQAAHARQNFFKPGNLSALRELALRFTAEKVNRQVETFRQVQPDAPTWHITEKILVLIGPSPSSAHLIRRACRLANALRCPWLALHVETPAQLRLSRKERDRTVQHLRMAEKLGAETATISGAALADAVLTFARERNVTKIVVGKNPRPAWRERLLGSFADALARRSAEIDVLVTAGDPADAPVKFPRLGAAYRATPSHYATSAGLVALCTIVCAPLKGLIEPTNLAMLYLMAIITVAWRLGRGPAILASILGVLSFDFFFVPPFHNFAVADTQYLFTFLVMLLIALTISTLTTQLRAAVTTSQLRERRTASLHALSRKLASTRGQAAILQATVEHLSDVFECQIIALLPDARGKLEIRAARPAEFTLDAREQGVAQWVYDLGQMAGMGTDTLPSAQALYVPLLASRGPAGALGLKPAHPERLLIPEQLHLLETLAQQAALSLEIDRLNEEGRQQQVQIETERLRSAILSSVSHDLRTPLTAITTAASSLLEPNEKLSGDSRRELLRTIYEESDHLTVQVNNLLEMTRLEAGTLKICKELQPLEETIGAACQRLERPLSGRPLSISLPPDLPMVPADGVLLERVFFNLLENATKYTPPGSPLEITARRNDSEVLVEIADRGPGLGEDEEERIFEKFYRGQKHGATGGAGLGLSICRGIILAHGGRVWAGNRSGGGAVFSFTLPLDVPHSPVDRLPAPG
ncbi:MAG: sensor histidine kinase KdpD [Planctomycetota bacterium]